MKAADFPAHIVAFMCEQREAGRSCEQIARTVRKQFGRQCSASAVSWNCLREGADPPGAKPLPQTAPGPAIIKRGRFVVRHYSPEEDALLLQLAEDGVRPAIIGRTLDPPRRGNSIKGRLLTLARHQARRDGSSI